MTGSPSSSAGELLSLEIEYCGDQSRAPRDENTTSVHHLVGEFGARIETVEVARVLSALAIGGKTR